MTRTGAHARDEDPEAPDGSLRPLWILTFGVPGTAMLFLWGMAALIAIRFEPMGEVLFRLSLAIPAIELVRLPFLLSRPSPRPGVGDFVVTFWGLLANGWPLVAFGANPWTLPFCAGFLFYGLALLVLLTHSGGGSLPDPGGPGDASITEPNGTI